jgi:hypothetical protein
VGAMRDRVAARRETPRATEVAEPGAVVS